LIGPESLGNTGVLAGRHILPFKTDEEEVGAMYKLFVGIDVAKGSSVGHGLDGTAETLFSLGRRKRGT
jgi:hypothetical protein